MAGVVDVIVFQPLVDRLMESPEGPVGRYLTEKTEQIEQRAQQNAAGDIIGIRSGDLLGGIQRAVVLDDGGLVGRVFTDAIHRGFNYPAYHDQNGRPWLTTALQDAFAG